jgi:hypothetical protein
MVKPHHEFEPLFIVGLVLSRSDWTDFKLIFPCQVTIITAHLQISRLIKDRQGALSFLTAPFHNVGVLDIT